MGVQITNSLFILIFRISTHENVRLIAWHCSLKSILLKLSRRRNNNGNKWIQRRLRRRRRSRPLRNHSHALGDRRQCVCYGNTIVLNILLFLRSHMRQCDDDDDMHNSCVATCPVQCSSYTRTHSCTFEQSKVFN